MFCGVFQGLPQLPAHIVYWLIAIKNVSCLADARAGDGVYMNKKAKRRLVVVGGIVVIAMLVIVAIAGAGGAASSLKIGDVLGGTYEGKKVQVSGAVVADSLSAKGSTAVFQITPEDNADTSQKLTVSYDGALPATFGTGVVAICTGTVDDGELSATELVTKCPSKYESAEGSLTVKNLLDQADSMTGKDTKVCGYIRGEINDATSDYRFTIESQGATMNVVYEGALPDDLKDGTAVVISGKLNTDGTFEASDQPAVDSSIKA